VRRFIVKASGSSGLGDFTVENVPSGTLVPPQYLLL
jgi:hypothetical protein